MAKFTSKNIEFKDGQKAIFGTDDDSSIYWNNDNTELTITTVVSGVDPTEEGHLVTKRYADQLVASDTGDFLELTDTPTSYSGAAGYVVSVNSAEDGLEFTDPGIYNIDGGFAASVYGGVSAPVDGGGA
jgi:hypothetical protein